MSAKLILCFFLYAALGWITEVIYCAIIDKKVVNRGFLKGPICPIYGIGAVSVIILLGDFKKNIIIFILGSLIASVIEYITSYLLEILFQTTWWDYSSNKFNINGRVCLLNSTLFGILAVLLIKFIHPYIIFILSIITEKVEIIVAILLISIITIDIIKSIKTLFAINKNVYKLEEFIIELKKHNLDLHNILQDEGKRNYKNKKLKNRFKNKLKKKISLSNREKILLNAFPKGYHKKYNESFKILRKFKKKL